jgi:excinuclease ABC subunit B
LREGLDLPEVSLVIILDADKEGFLRSHRSLTQTIGRAARNINGKAIMYANRITKSMQKTIDETAYRRNKQKLHNKQFKINPTPLNKGINDIFIKDDYKKPDLKDSVVNEDFKNLSKVDKEKQIRKYRTEMEKAAKSLDFVEAARIRDIIKLLKK